MKSAYDFKNYGILYVDDENNSLKYFRQAFEKKFRIFTASNAQEGFRILHENQDTIALVMSDQQMPGEKGVQLLERAKLLNPHVRRVLVTAYSDVDSAVQAINEGEVHRYISKPWDLDDLEITLTNSLQDFIHKTHQDKILNEKILLLYQQIIADRQLNLGIVSSGFSHHLRNLLVTVKTFLDFVPSQLKKAEIDPRSQNNRDFWLDLFKKAGNSLEKIDKLLNELCNLTVNMECRIRDKVKLNQVIDETIRDKSLSFKSNKIKIVNRISEDLPAITVDKPKCYQLFDLLLDDEILNLPAGSEIVLDACETIGRDNKSRVVSISVSDNGSRVPDEALQSVFDPFFVRSNNPKEFGVNLVTCFFIIYQHGGEIRTRNNAEQGLTFTLEFLVDPPRSVFNDKQDGFIQKMIMSEFFMNASLLGNETG